MSKVHNKPPYIAVVKYKGRNGGFATTESTRYRSELVGLNGCTIRLDEWGFSERQHAQSVADKYAKATGFEIVAINETRKVHVTTERSVE